MNHKFKKFIKKIIPDSILLLRIKFINKKWGVKNKNLKELFSSIYLNNLWNTENQSNDTFYSGIGSRDKDTISQYQNKIKDFFKSLKYELKVLDLGCGNGFYTLELARRVGPEGTVYAVDIQPQMLRLLVTRARQEKLFNIQPILGTFIDPRLPEGDVDLVFCVDVYHEFSHPEMMLKRIRESLSDSGQIVLAEFRGEDATVPIKPLHKMTKLQVKKELEPNGFVLEREFDKLPWQHLMFFGVQNEE